jgi:transcriptional regulator with XRE-family HTH domain
MDIIKFIKEKVLEAGSQTAVARKTGVSQGTIAKICNGDTNPELGTIYKISSAYGIPPSSTGYRFFL